MARRGKKARATNRYAHLTEPDAVLDFHDLGPVDGGDVQRALERFLAAARREGHARVRVITGRGLHSRDSRPFVKPRVRKQLDALLAAEEIRAFHAERLDAGGDGAFLVTL